jgi:hypothetical protein
LVRGAIAEGSLPLGAVIPSGWLLGIRASRGSWVSGGSTAIFASVHDLEAVVRINGFNRFDSVFAEGAGFRGSDHFFCDTEGESLEEDSDDRMFLEIVLRFPRQGLELLNVQVDISIFEGQLLYAFPGFGVLLRVEEPMLECLEEVAP